MIDKDLMEEAMLPAAEAAQAYIDAGMPFERALAETTGIDYDALMEIAMATAESHLVEVISRVSAFMKAPDGAAEESQAIVAILAYEAASFSAAFTAGVSCGRRDAARDPLSDSPR